jgi:hypothetical protein
MERQARNGDTVLVTSREMTGMTQILPCLAWGRRGKDDRKQNTLAPLYGLHDGKAIGSFCTRYEYVRGQRKFQNHRNFI